MLLDIVLNIKHWILEALAVHARYCNTYGSNSLVLGVITAISTGQLFVLHIFIVKYQLLTDAICVIMTYTNTRY